jgi:hypothetical protein
MAQQKYMFVYHTPKSAPPRQPSPEELQQMFARWDAWKSKFASHIIDKGDGLKPGGKLLANGVVTDGPFPETKDIVGGYSIVQGESYEHALTIARECPVAQIPGATIEIRELAGY